MREINPWSTGIDAVAATRNKGVDPAVAVQIAHFDGPAHIAVALVVGRWCVDAAGRDERPGFSSLPAALVDHQIDAEVLGENIWVPVQVDVPGCRRVPAEGLCLFSPQQLEGPVPLVDPPAHPRPGNAHLLPAGVADDHIQVAIPFQIHNLHPVLERPLALPVPQAQAEVCRHA